MRHLIEKTVAPLKRRIYLMIGRAVLTALDDSGQRQRVQFKVLKGEVKGGVERVQQYGFTSHPLAGAQVVAVFLGGNRDHPLAINVDDPRHRLTGLQPGEVALYTDEGDSVILKRGKTIQINSGNKVEINGASDVEVNCANFTVNASTAISLNSPETTSTGEISDFTGETMNDMRQIYNVHEHPENDGGGPTDDPNEKMAGGA